MDTARENFSSQEEEIKHLRLELRKTKRKVEHLERDRRIMALMFDQSSRLRDINDAEAKRQSYYNGILLENSPDMIFLLNKELIVRMTTQAFYRISGLSLDVIGLTLRQALSASISDFWIDRLETLSKEVMDKNEPAHLIEHLDIGNTQNHIYEIFVSPARSQIDNSVLGIILIFRDITDLAEAKERAEAADIAKTNFLANMSHEVRTPLNAIIGISEFILRDSRRPLIIEYGTQIRNASNALLAIINDILDFSKIEANRLELVNTEFHSSTLINKVVDIITAPVQDHNLKFSLEVSPDIPSTLLGDERRIQQIIINLVSNALKYTPQGSITLKFWQEPVTDNIIKLYGSVADTGIGIKEEDHSKLFESFVRVDTTRNRSIEGTGLGLPISQRIAQAMKGNISFTSVYGKGSTFTFYVECQAVGEKKIGPVNLKGLKTESQVFTQSFSAPLLKLLIVDDNQVNLMVAEGIFEVYKCTIATASSGAEALELARKEHYDIIFMDHMMPIMDGIETMQRLRQLPEYAEAPIIVLTANAISGMREAYLAEGFSDYLPKPINLQEADRILGKYTPANYKHEPSYEKKRKTVTVDEEILHQVYTDGLEKIKLLPQLVEKGDFANYTIQVHALKSVAALIGEAQLSEYAKMHEFAGKDGQTEYIVSRLPELINHYQRLLDRLALKYADTEQSQTGPILQRRSASLEEMQQLFLSMQHSLDDYDLDTFATLIKEAKKLQLSPKHTGCIGSMQAALDNFDFDQLNELMQVLRQ